jgi:hypothetical protein
MPDIFSPEFIRDIYESNKIQSPEAKKLRDDYARVFKDRPYPETPEEAKEIRDTAESIAKRAHGELSLFDPSIQQKILPGTPSFEDWKKTQDFTELREAIREKFPNSDVEEKLDTLIKPKFQKWIFARYYQSRSSDPEKPAEFKESMQAYRDKLTAIRISQIPENLNKGTFTILMGYAGSGKSSAIEAEDVPGTPFQTSSGALVLDSDRFQPDIPGYNAGAGAAIAQTHAMSVHGNVLKHAMGQKYSVVLPIVGGETGTMTSKIADALLSGYDNVVIKFKNTPPAVAMRNVINRAIEIKKDLKEEGRLIPPISGPGANPFGVYEELSGKNATTDEIFAKLNLADVYSKLIEKTKAQIKLENGYKNVTQINPAELNERMARFNNLDNMVHFELIPYTEAKILLRAVRLAKVFESRKQYSVSDMLIELIYNY